MSLDVIIRGGTVFDGTGRPGFRADVGIREGRIAAIGRIADPADRVIDAEGAIVTPGFVDIHTHYDGQACWDETLAPSSLHGVTTAVMGNCGVGFAPLHSGDEETLIALMEGVEEIPGVALAEGVGFEWESFGDYLDRLGERSHAVDLVTQVTHDPLRLYVMGERGAAGEAATVDDIAAMRKLAAEALRAGAYGISSGRTDVHKTAHGTDTPARTSTGDELEGLAAALRDAGHGVFQLVSDFRLADGPNAFDDEFDLVERIARAGGRPVSVSLNQRDLAPDQWTRILDRVEAANAAGLAMKVQVAARGIGVCLGLETTLNPLMAFPSYRAIHHRPLAERVRTLRDADFRRHLLTEERTRLSGPDSPVPPLADAVLERLDFFSLRMFRLEDPPDYEPPMADSLYYVARERGVGVMEAIYDVLLEEDGERLIYFPIYNYSRFDLADLRTMMTHPQALFGLSDGGAHVGTVCDASFPTFLLTHWARDRSRGERLPLEWLVKKQTRDNARHMGLHDRGVLAPGMKADINVIDFDRLRLPRPRIVHDLPAGGKRLFQGAEGYRATLVAGEPIVLDDALTDARPGRLLRAGSA
ncbi:MAG: D-aminoacylase [Alphaproteobacteria bacterium]|nr:MAG: D-aminoacylase [Alphaproteobacteria bacterium]